MPTTQAKIAIALALTVLAVFGFLWQIANIRGLRSRGRKRSGREGDAKAAQRKSDSRNLKGSEKRLYNEAQRLLTQNKIAPAARILEQLNMPREAIQALEDHGMIHDAAKILMRMQRHNRAGVVYARHGLWENAAQCFKMANMPVEVAKCAREAGDLPMAAEYFEKAGRLEDAGECLEQLGEHHRAARFFSTAGNRTRAMGLYNRLATAAQNISALQLEEDEVQQISDYLSEGNVETGLADVVSNRNKLTGVIINLVSKGLVKQAGEMIVRSSSDIGPMLMAEVSYQTRAAACLAELFYNTTQFHYAGMVYERMTAFERAGEAFEKSEDFDRAAYCYERAGIDFKVKLLKEKARVTPHAPRRNGPSGRPSGFALANVQTSGHGTRTVDEEAAADEDLQKEAAERAQGDEDRTALLRIRDLENATPPPAASLPPPPRATPHPAPQAAPRPVPAQAAPSTPTTPAFAASFSLRDIDDEERSTDTNTSPSAERGHTAPSAQPTPLNRGDTQRSEPESTNLSAEDGRAAFHKAAFFADLDFDQKNKLWAIGKTLSFGADETVLTYNDEPKGVYVIVQGSVSCYRQGNGKEAYVDQMGESESFGELWLLADQPTAVRFVASQDTQIRVVDRLAFNDLLDHDGMIARKLYKRFTMRLLKRLLKPTPAAPVAAVPPVPGRGQQAS